MATPRKPFHINGRPMFYRLLDGKAVPIETIEDLVNVDSELSCRIDFTEIGDYAVSTAFLGTDLNLFASVTKRSIEESPPLAFETAILHGNEVEIFARHATEASARIGHAKAIETVQSRIKAKNASNN